MYSRLKEKRLGIGHGIIPTSSSYSEELTADCTFIFVHVEIINKYCPHFYKKVDHQGACLHDVKLLVIPQYLHFGFNL